MAVSKTVLLAGWGLLLAGTISARAEVVNYNSDKPWYMPSEASLGAGKTDVFRNIEASPNVTGEMMFQPVGNASWYDELRFRPTIGFNSNAGNETSYGYLGANFDLLNFYGFYVDGFFGLSATDGELHPNLQERMTHRALGSVVEFRSAASLGYQWTPEFGTSVYLDHQSNAGIFDKTNQGIETAGVRFSYLWP
jgi:hypothetical protein